MIPPIHENIVIGGASGAVGTGIVRHCLAQGHRVVAVVRDEAKKVSGKRSRARRAVPPGASPADRRLRRRGRHHGPLSPGCVLSAALVEEGPGAFQPTIDKQEQPPGKIYAMGVNFPD